MIIKNGTVEITITDNEMHHLDIKSTKDLLLFMNEIIPKVKSIGFEMEKDESKK